MELKNVHLTRQADIIPEKVLGTPIHVIGAGAIGSFAVLSLTKMGFWNVFVWDYDTVDTVNMNCQFYPFSSIGEPKVCALQALIKDFAQVEIAAVNDKYTTQTLTPTGIVLSCADSMEVRKAVFDNNPMAKIIDTRMGAEFAAMYVVANTKDRESYKETLYSDAEAVQAPCTAKATVYTATLLAGQAVKAVKDLVLDKDYLFNLQWDIAGNNLEAWK